MEKLEKIKSFLSNYYTIFAVWMILPLYTAAKSVYENNFLIFKYVFHHAMAGTSLYVRNPAEYDDLNHYGPFFMLVIAPFAMMPVWLGHLLWQIVLTLFLYFAVRKSTFSRQRQLFILWFCANELLTALFLSQFNVAIAAIILLTYYFIEKEKDEWATLMILFGTFVKLYGIVGLAFFFFSRHKVKFCVSFAIWTVILFVAPMAIVSPEYLVDQYREWFFCLQDKNLENMFALDENICLLGMVRKISGCATYSDLWLIIPGLLLFGAPYLRFSQYKNAGFRETILASTMMFVVLFSTGSESYGYITPLIGIVIWYTASPWKRSKWDIALLVFVFILTSLSPGDLFPRALREAYVKPYALKALPVTLVWFKLCYEMMTKDYSNPDAQACDSNANTSDCNAQSDKLNAQVS